KKRKADMDTIFSATVPPLERFERYFVYVHDHLAEVQKKCGSILGCPLLSVGSEVCTQDEMLREKVQEILDRRIRYFESAIRDADCQGLIGAQDAKAKAKGLFACYQGTLAQARIENNLEPLREFKHFARDILGATQGVVADRS